VHAPSPKFIKSGLGCALALLLAALLVGLGWLLAPLWPSTGWVSPVTLGPLRLRVNVPLLLQRLSTPLIAAQLDGTDWPSRVGTLHLAWQAPTQTLHLRCAPCHWQHPSWGPVPLTVPSAELSVQRQGTQWLGVWQMGALHGTWQGQLDADQLQVQLQLPPQPLRSGYALWADAIPELARARIDGQFSLHAQLTLPSGQLALQPQVWGWTVQGLGTEALAHAQSTCPASPVPLGSDSLLARAVVAAEDQRFFEHAGLDWAELQTSLQRNQQLAPLRGASTLSQQLAKLLITGSQRHPTRKLREWLYAVEMEQTLGKARILRLYLAHAPWGPGLCGAEAAARHYFGVSAHQLNAAQAVWLAAMLHNPDLEAERWTRTGHINQPRAVWIAAQLRPASPRQSLNLQRQLQTVQWQAPGAP